MENNIADNIYDKIDKKLILFDKGFSDIQEISSKKKLTSDKEKQNRITWYTLYMKLFKNTLLSKNLIPKEEFKLRLNILRKYLPSYHNPPKPFENTNSNSILKKFSYHIYPKNNLFKRLLDKFNRKRSVFIFDEEETKEKDSSIIDTKKTNFQRKEKKTKTLKLSADDIKIFNFGASRKRQSQNFQPKDLKVIQEYSPTSKLNLLNIKSSEIPYSSPTKKNKRDVRKRTTVKMEGAFANRLLFNQKKKQNTPNLFFYEMEKKAKLKLDQKRKNNDPFDLENIDNDYIIRTPNDNEYSLVLSDKRNMDNKRTYFYEYLNKLNLETKNEKVNTYKKEVASQLLKFNELYYDSKLDDFNQDKVFSEIKSHCDFFINKFNLDKQEEKNIVDLEKFL